MVIARSITTMQGPTYLAAQPPGTPSLEVPGPSATLFANPYYSTTGTNWYVSVNSGSDITGDGSAGKPWATLAKANSMGPTAGTVINVASGTYANATTITSGGNGANKSGYVVYRSQTLGGAVITDPGGFNVTANYVIFDGFVMTASSQLSNGVAVGTINLTGGYAYHHIWVMNCVISEYGQSGVQLNNAEWFYVIHNTFFGNSTNPAYQGSGVSLASLEPTVGYVLTSDDQNNPVTGNTGTLFHNFVMWNIVYNNYEAGFVGSSDGNGIIFDSLSNYNYVFGSLAAFNISYNNGGAGVHIFGSQYVTAANNSCYSNYLDTNDSNTLRGGIDTNGSYGCTIVNNISYAVTGSGVLTYCCAVNPLGPPNCPYTNTLGTAISTTNSTTVLLSSDTEMPNGSAGQVFSGSYALPGGNMIQIDSETMRVTAGWGTTTLTVQRGYYGSTAATHASGATVYWRPDYWANNITFVNTTNGAAANGDGSTMYFGGDVYSLTLNLPNTNPEWVNVGNTSFGTESTPPIGANFALQPTSPAIGYGQTFSWLSPQSIDAGALHH